MKVTTFLLSIFCLSAYGQDYLVTTKGDTLRGKIKIMSYDQLDRVQVTEPKKKTTFTALQVKLIVNDSAVFHPHAADRSIRFMKLLKPGYLSLYASRDESQNYTRQYLIKRDGAMIEVPNLTFKKSMMEFLADSEEIKQRLENKEYSKKDLHRLIDDYNTFIETNTVARKETVLAHQKAVQKTEPLEKLKKTVEGQNDFDSKKDALDLIDDIIAKIKNHQAVPNYLLDGLQKYLAGIDAAQEDLQQVISMIKE